MLKYAQDLINAGASGLVYGRNIIHHEDPRGITRKFMKKVELLPSLRPHAPTPACNQPATLCLAPHSVLSALSSRPCAAPLAALLACIKAPPHTSRLLQSPTVR